MAAAVGLRGDYAAVDLRGLARRSGDADQVRRLLALAVIYAGGSRHDQGALACRRCAPLVLRFNARAPEGLPG